LRCSHHVDVVKLEPDHLVGLDGVRDAFGKGRIGETKAVLGAPQLDITSSTAQFDSPNGPNELRERVDTLTTFLYLAPRF
jgi:hypothetical protein